MSKKAAVTFEVDMKRLNEAFNRISAGIDRLNRKFNDSDSRLQKTAAGYEKSFKKMLAAAGDEKSFKKMLAAAGGLATLKAAYDAFVSEGVKTQFLSMDTGESVENIQAWSEAIKRVGGSADSVQNSIKGLHDGLYRLSRVGGNPELIKALAFSGVSPADGQGLKKSTDLLLELADVYENLSMDEARFRGSLFGFDDATVRLLKLGRKELEAMLEVYKKNQVLTKEDTAAAVAFRKSLFDLTQAMRRVAAVGMRFLTPLLAAVTKHAEQFINFLARNKYFVVAFFSSLAALITAVMLPALAKLAVAQIAAFGPLLAIAAIIGLLFDDFKTWQEGGKTLFDWQGFIDFKKDLEPLLTMLQKIAIEFGKFAVEIGRISLSSLTTEGGLLNKALEGINATLNFIIAKLVKLKIIKSDDPVVQKELEGLADEALGVGDVVKHVIDTHPILMVSRAADALLSDDMSNAMGEFFDILTTPSQWFVRKDLSNTSGGGDVNIYQTVEISTKDNPVDIAKSVSNATVGGVKAIRGDMAHLFAGGTR